MEPNEAALRQEWAREAPNPPGEGPEVKPAARLRFGALFPVVVVVLLLAFHYQRSLDHQLEPPGPSFSRPLDLAWSDISGSATAQVTPEGDLLVLWSARGGVDYVLVSPQAAIKGRGRIPLHADTPTGSPTSLLATPSALFWLAGPALTELYWAPLSFWPPSPGEPVHLASGISTVRLLSGPADTVLAAGPGDLLWFPLDQSGRPGRVHRAANWNATLVDGVCLGPDRIAVVGAVTERSSFCLQYSELKGGTVSDPRALGTYPLAEHELVRQVRCGSDGEWLYTFVTREKRDRGNLEITTYWTAWPASSGPPERTPDLAPLPVTRIGERPVFWLAEPDPASGCSAAGEQGLAVAFTALNRGRYGQDEDAAVVWFADGRVGESQFAGLTRGAAGQPHLVPAPDGAGGYFLTWVDTAGTGRFVLRVTASVPAFRQEMARVRTTDVTAALGETFVGVFLSYLPFLFALGWTVTALVVLAVGHIFALDWAERHPRWLGLMALAVYLVTKAWLLWRLLHAPVLALRAPSWLSPSLTAPILLAAAGPAALAALPRYRQSESLAWLGAFVLWDVVLTCLFLGPLFR